MGLAKKHRKKFISHKKRWDKETIVDETKLTKDYALKNKKEVRKIELKLSIYKKLAKEMNRNAETKNSEEAKHFIQKLKTLGFLSAEATSLDEVLDIKIRDLLERRLSNIIYKNKFAKTPRQARQFVVHGHVKVDGKVITAPSYLVPLTLESSVEFSNTSALADENHPERKLEKEGLQAVEEEMENTPLKTEDGSFDEKEAKLDEEESDEVKE